MRSGVVVSITAPSAGDVRYDGGDSLGGGHCRPGTAGATKESEADDRAACDPNTPRGVVDWRFPRTAEVSSFGRGTEAARLVEGLAVAAAAPEGSALGNTTRLTVVITRR